MAAIKTPTINAYRTARAAEGVSVATVNRELRHIRAALHVACDEYKYLPEVPKVKMLKEPQKIPRFVTEEHFAAIYGACEVAKFPQGTKDVVLPFTAGDWWWRCWWLPT